MSQEPTIRDVLDAVNEFSSKTDERFSRIDERFSRIESKMATKDYIDDKIINLKADLAVLMRKEDRKLEALTMLLVSKKLITDGDAKQVLAMEPFPQQA